MVHLGTWILIVSLALTAHGEEEACWEQCFRYTTYEDGFAVFQDFFSDIQETAQEINALKNLYGITKIGFALDSSVRERYNVPFEDIPVTEAQLIFAVQTIIVNLLSVMVNGAQNFVVQYDESSAWSCAEFNCLDTCELAQTFNVEPVASVGPHVGPTSHCLGNVEAACSLLNNYMTNCNNNIEKTMVVAVVNDDFYLNDHSRHNSDSREDHHCPPHHWHVDGHSSSSDEDHQFSPCLTHFDTRYVVGVNSQTKKVMERFISKHGNYKDIKNDRTSIVFQLFGMLEECTVESCCSAVSSNYPVTSCSKTQGPIGEIISDFPESPYLDILGTRRSLEGGFRQANLTSLLKTSRLTKL